MWQISNILNDNIESQFHVRGTEEYIKSGEFLIPFGRACSVLPSAMKEHEDQNKHKCVFRM